jgi:RHS repeat-associated protein
MTALPGFTPTYDADGNVTSDSNHTYSWDANGNSTTIDGIAITFDAMDRMVEQNRSGTLTQIVYTPTGQKFALMNGATLKKAFIQLPGSGTAVYTSAGLDHYRHSDWLGNNRLSSSTTRTILSSVAYAPFGETYASSGTPDLSFTGQNSDTTSGDYDFPHRQYSNQGRWASPDPAGLAAVDVTSPQSLNRYGYVSNSPLDRTDPLGLCSGVAAGLGASPGSSQGLQQFADENNMNVAFPYADQNEGEGVGDAILQSAGIPTAATLVMAAFIVDTVQQSQAQGVKADFYLHSGSAPAFTLAASLLPFSITSQIGSITYVQPGGIGPGSSGNGPTSVYSNPSLGNLDAWIDMGGYATSPINNVTPIPCRHDSNCSFRMLPPPPAGAGCPQKKSFSRGRGGLIGFLTYGSPWWLQQGVDDFLNWLYSIPVGGGVVTSVTIRLVDGPLPE